MFAIPAFTPVCGNFPGALVLSWFVLLLLLFPLLLLFSDACFTVTVQLAFLVPSCEVTVIIVEPIFLGVTFPVLSTVATDSSLDFQVTILFVVFEGLKFCSLFLYICL